ncbi:MAG: TonB-dependent receptor [Bacteroidales bacterium]|nr:TonB-dependent receptor [Bacteroidales bacterium]
MICNAASGQKHTISGYITDQKSQETVIGAAVFDQNSRHGTISNTFGFYSITLNDGAVKMRYSYVGYQTQEAEFNLTKDTVINISLSENTVLSEVVVTGRKETGIESTKMGSLDIPVKMIEHTPTLLGETDVIKTIQLTPGVQQGIGGSSAFYVRGGNGDENLVLLDGAPVYKIDHLFGFFSVFTPEAVKKVTFYKSSFPARYNGRVSSIVDVRTKDGDMQEFHGTVATGILSSRLNLEGPIFKGRTSYNFSARTTYMTFLAYPFMKKFMQDEFFTYFFYDVNAKINHKFSDRDRLYVSFYKGIDKFEYGGKTDVEDWGYKTDDTGKNIPITYHNKGQDDVYLNWGNTISTMRWNHVFSSQLFANTTLIYNHYDMNTGYHEETKLTGDVNRYQYSKSNFGSEITDYGAIIDFDYMPSPRHAIKFGASYTYHNFAPETLITKEIDKDSERPDENVDTVMSHAHSRPHYGNELSVYAENDWKISSNFSLMPSCAITLFNIDHKNFINIQPRFSMKYDFLENWAMKASYSRMSQCVHLLTSTPVSMPTDLWVPITQKLKPETSDLFSIGFYYTGLKMWDFSIETYYKYLNNVVEYKDGKSYVGFAGSWEDLVALGTGTSKGIEFMIEKTSGKATGWISYTLSKSDRDFAENSGVNFGRKFPFTYDRRHNVSIVYTQRFGKRFELDASWTYYSGAHATLAKAKETVLYPDYYDDEEWGGRGLIQTNETNTDYVVNKNNYTLPAVHMLNIGISFHEQKKRCERIWNFSFYNAYNRKNANLARIKHEDERLRLQKITILPLIPSFTLTYKF